MLIKGLGVTEPPKPNTLDVTKMPPRYPFTVPRLIRMTAKEFAGTFYEGMCRYSGPTAFASTDYAKPDFEAERSRRFREHWKSEKLYVAWCWPLYVRTARASLAAMLGQSTVSEHMKKEIYEALAEEYDPGAFQNGVVSQLIGFAP